MVLKKTADLDVMGFSMKMNALSRLTMWTLQIKPLHSKCWFSDTFNYPEFYTMLCLLSDSCKGINIYFR